MKKETMQTVGPEWEALREELQKLRRSFHRGEKPPGEYIVELLTLGYRGYRRRAADLGGPSWNDEQARKEAGEYLGSEADSQPFSSRRRKGDWRDEELLKKATVGLKLPSDFMADMFLVFWSQKALIDPLARVEAHVVGLFSNSQGAMRPQFEHISGFVDEGVRVSKPFEAHIRRAAVGRFNFSRVADVLGWSEEVCRRVERSLERAFPGKGGEVVNGLQKTLVCWLLWRNLPYFVTETVRELIAKEGDLALKKSLVILAKGSSKEVAEIWEEFRWFREKTMTKKEKEEIRGERGEKGSNREVIKWLKEKAGETDPSALVGKALVSEEAGRRRWRLVADICFSAEGFPNLLLYRQGKKQKWGFGVATWKHIEGCLVEELPDSEVGERLTVVDKQLSLLVDKLDSSKLKSALEKRGFELRGLRGLMVRGKRARGLSRFVGHEDIVSVLRLAELGEEWREVEEVAKLE